MDQRTGAGGRMCGAMKTPSPSVMHILSDVGQQREPTEGADDVDGHLGVHPRQQRVDPLGGHAPVSSRVDGLAPQRLDQIEDRLARLLGDQVTEQPAKQSDIAIECLVRGVVHVGPVVG